MSKLNKSWEKDKSGAPHSPKGIESLKKSVKNGLLKYYSGIAETMFGYDGLAEDPRFADMLQMSRDTAPEKFYFRNGQCCLFEIGDQLHILPMVFEQNINIYGYESSWHPVPVGWTDGKDGRTNPEAWVKIMTMKLDASNSVVLRNDMFGQSDFDFVNAMVNELVDNVLTVNQLQLLASVPYVFRTTEDNLLSAKNYFLSIAEHRPVIFMNSLGEKLEAVIESTGVKIDPAIFEIYDRWECMLLESLGFPCVPITKRAQQTVSEVQSNADKIYMKRREKLLQRQRDWERVNRMFGTNVRVYSVIDEENTVGPIIEGGEEND